MVKKKGSEARCLAFLVVIPDHIIRVLSHLGSHASWDTSLGMCGM